MIRVYVAGSSGRMGQLLLGLIEADSTLSDAKTITECDVIVDFSSPDACIDFLQQALDSRVPFVSGTTGLSAQQFDKLEDAAKEIPVFYAANFSQGVFVLGEITKLASKLQHLGWQPKINETHHIHKLDSPSGTAKFLATKLDSVVEIDAKREGEEVGMHEIIFESGSETLSLKHRAKSRMVFAEGAIQAARWLITKAPGFYSMNDLLC